MTTTTNTDDVCARLTARRAYLTDLATAPATHRGECDVCHREPLELRTDDDEPGDYQWCRSCLIRAIARLTVALRNRLRVNPSILAARATSPTCGTLRYEHVVQDGRSCYRLLADDRPGGSLTDESHALQTIAYWRGKGWLTVG